MMLKFIGYTESNGNIFLEGHHFDNPVYTTYRPSSPLANIEPLNNIR